MPDDAPQLENVEDVLPLSPVQAGMLYEILSGSTPQRTYTAFVRIELDGPLDADAARAAFAQIAMAADSTRACFLHDGLDQPVQVIRREVELPVAFDDLSDLPDATAKVCALEQELREADLPLTRAPLMQARLVRMAPDRHVLMWATHHLISDGWSVQVMTNDLLARLNGQPPLPPGPPFKKHLSLLSARDRQDDRAFWTKELEALDGPTLLAPDGISAELARASHGALLDAATTTRLLALARELRVSPATLLSLGWSLTLRRLTGRDDVVFGLVSSGRDPRIPGIDRAIGQYLNVTPWRLKIDPATPLREVANQARSATQRRARYEHSALSDATIAGVLPFDTILSIKTFAYRADPPAGPIQAREMLVENLTPYPFSVIVNPGETTQLTAYYDTGRIAHGAACGILDAYRDILRAIADRPDAPVRDLAARTLPPIPQIENAPHLPAAIHSAALRWPDRCAIRAEDAELSYRELDMRAAALASQLSDAGIGTGDLVPVLMPRGARAVVAMLGVLYSGAAYVPIDIDYPVARIAQILEQIKPRVAISDDPTAVPSARTISVPNTGLTGNPVETRDSDPAYVIFTSGSTGRPKGVVVTHTNLACSTVARDGVYGQGPAAFLHLSSFAFDSSVVGLYWTLACGGSLVIAPPKAEQDPGRLLAHAGETGVSHLLALPRLWSALLAAGPVPPTLDTVIVAGEAVPQDLPSRHRAHAPGVRLFNEYGPTEATVWCAAAEITEVDGPVPIGRAPKGMAIEVCDVDAQPLPPDIEGDLIVRGQGIAAGYLNQPEATARAFLDGPERRYRTGDRGVMTTDGTLLYRGRADTQVKLRGHRVELSEVEAMARDAGAPAAAAALTDGRIVLAVTGAADAVRAALPERLPPALMPIPVHAIDCLPLLPNGKIDRAAIAALGHGADREGGSATGFFQRRLAGLWSRLLKIEAGPDTHFFDAGGDSLASIALIAAAEEEGIALRPGDIFDHPVLRDLAAVLDDRANQPVAIEHDRLVATSHGEGRRRPFFMIHGSQRMNAALAAALGPDRPLVFRYSHYLGGDLPRHIRIEDLAAEAVDTIREIQPQGPYLIGGYSLGAIIAVEAVHQLSAQGHEIAGLFLIDPSFAGAPPHGTHETLARKLRRTGSAGLAALRLLTGRGKSTSAKVGAIYARVLMRYRPTVWNGPATLIRSTSGRADTLSIDATLPNARAIDLPFGHLELQNDNEAIADWTARLAADVRQVEGVT